MTANEYYRIGSFPNPDLTEGSDLYSGQGFDNYHTHPSESLRPDMHTSNMSSNSYNSNGHHLPPTKPLRPDLYATHMNGNSYTSSPQHFMKDTYNNLPPKPASNNWTAKRPHPPDPATKPLVNSSHVPVPQPLKIQTPNSRLRQRKYQTLKRYLRIGKIITQVITILFSTTMFAIMVFMAIKFQTTKNEFRGGRTAWPKQPKLWPMFMLLVGAGLTLILSVITLLWYCCAFNKARRSWKLTVVKYVIHIGAWLVISALYRYEKDTNGVENDLWGWSCSTTAADIQAEFSGVLNFSSLCSVQVRY